MEYWVKNTHKKKQNTYEPSNNRKIMEAEILALEHLHWMKANTLCMCNITTHLYEP